MSLLGSGTALPGCRASSLHQQIASIPFLQELPRAPRKGEKQRGGVAKATVVPGGCSQNKHMGLSQKMERVVPEVPRHSEIFLDLCLVLEKWVQGMSQLL